MFLQLWLLQVAIKAFKIVAGILLFFFQKQKAKKEDSHEMSKKLL